MNDVGQFSEAGLRVAVIGAGITGLAATHRLISTKSDCHVTVFEASDRAGGIIRTESSDDFLMEMGPDAFITNKPGGVQLCEELGFTDQLISTDNRYRRSLVLRRGKPLAVPDGFMLMAPAKPWAIATTPILSMSGKMRLLREALVKRKSNDDDESLADFVRRRFGSEALDRLIQPLVGGIYTSDPEKLSLKATLPRFLDMEQQHGSVIRATLRQQKANAAGRDATSGSGARYGLFATPKNGLSSLIRTLMERLAGNGNCTLRLETPVKSVQPSDSGWNVSTDSGTENYDAVIMTLPTHRAATVLSDGRMAALSGKLTEIEYASSVLVVSGHRISDFDHPLDAFGMVVPIKERKNVLAVSFTSRKFPDRAPDGHILLRTFVGGAMQPELVGRDDDEIRQLVNSDLRSIFGMKVDPSFSLVERYNKAMPQYHVGHLDRIAEIERLTSEWRGLQLAGSAYHGVGIPDSISSGRNAADAIVNSLHPIEG